MNLIHTTNLQVHSNYTCFLASLIVTEDPIHFKEVVKHEHWVKAMNQELETLKLNNT